MENRGIEIFCCYSPEDHEFLVRLEQHLKPLFRDKPIIQKLWHSARVLPGAEWGPEISKRLNSAHIILLLVSPDSLASDYLHDIEMKIAMERHAQGKARVIPVILRPVDWQQASFRGLLPLPKGGEPIVNWRNQDEAFLNVAKGISEVVETFLTQPGQSKTLPHLSNPLPSPSAQPGQSKTFPYPPDPQPSQSASSFSDVIQFHGLEMAVSPDGSRVAAVGMENNWPVIHLRDTITRDVRTYPLPRPDYTHQGKPRTIAWSPDGLRIITSSSEGELYIFNSLSGEHMRTYVGHIREVQTSDVWVSSLSWSPDGSRIASAAATVQIWDATTAICLYTFSGHSSLLSNIWGRPPHITDATWSPDGSHIASASSNRSVLIWNATPGNIIQPYYYSYSCDSQQVAWSPDGSCIVFSGQRNQHSVIYVRGTVKGNSISEYHEHSVRIDALAWSPDGSRIASLGADSTVRIWEAFKGNTLFSGKLRRKEEILRWSSRNR